MNDLGLSGITLPHILCLNRRSLDPLVPSKMMSDSTTSIKKETERCQPLSIEWSGDQSNLAEQRFRRDGRPVTEFNASHPRTHTTLAPIRRNFDGSAALFVELWAGYFARVQRKDSYDVTIRSWVHFDCPVETQCKSSFEQSYCRLSVQLLSFSLSEWCAICLDG